jgi:sulfur carrier protein ThiS
MSIVVSVETFGLLNRTTEPNEFKLNISEGSTVYNILESIQLPKKDFDFIIIIVNNAVSKFDTKLNNGDEIVLTMHLGGG